MSPPPLLLSLFPFIFLPVCRSLLPSPFLSSSRCPVYSSPPPLCIYVVVSCFLPFFIYVVRPFVLSFFLHSCMYSLFGFVIAWLRSLCLPFVRFLPCFSLSCLLLLIYCFLYLCMCPFLSFFIYLCMYCFLSFFLHLFDSWFLYFFLSLCLYVCLSYGFFILFLFFRYLFMY